MYQKLDIKISPNELKNSTELKNASSLKSPFSNLMLRKIMIHQKIKTLNQIKKMKKDNKKKFFKQNNLYINFSDFQEQNLKNKNENIYEHNNSFKFQKNTKSKIISDENNYVKSIGNEGFTSCGKIFKNRNIRPLKLLLPAGKTLNNLKIKSYTNKNKDNSNKKIVFLNNKMLKINKMNITINKLPRLFNSDDKTIRSTKRFLPEIQEKKNFSNKRKQNILYRNKINNNNIIINNSNFIKTAQISIYENNNPKILFKNKTNNSIVVNNLENYKGISVGKIDNNIIYNSINIFQKDKLNNLVENNLNFNSLSNSNRDNKKKHSNIYKLLKLKNIIENKG